MGSKASDLVQECKRQSENCLYTSTSFFFWLRVLRWARVLFVAVPLAFGSAASWTLLTESDLESVKLTTSVLAFFAGLLPSVYAALKLDDRLEEMKQSAVEFKNLQDRFRQVALISSKKRFAEFDADFQQVMERMERAREPGHTPPEFIFKLAQRKVQSGDYTFDVDLEAAKDGASDDQERTG